jgi:ubiquinone biosynthesis accessory factor UbiJ
MTISAAAFATLETLLNQAIRLDPETPARLAPMHGRVIEIVPSGFAFSLYLIPAPNGIQLLSHFEGDADCSLRGNLLDLVRMRGTQESADQLFSGSVQLEGDARLAQQFGDFLSHLDIDWEEQLSRLTGDLVAHEVGQLARGIGRWGRRQSRITEQNLQEYLQEELRILPARLEMTPFLDGVDRLRDDTERLAARIAKLSKRLAVKDSMP